MTTHADRFVWFEYVSTDAPAAQAFFGALFGWTTKRVPMPEGEYAMIAAPDGRTIGGYFAAPDGGPGAGWLPYLRVPKVADAVGLIAQHGGAIKRPPFAVGDFATMAIAADPGGAGFALWQPKQPEDVPDDKPGHVIWNELSSKTPAGAAAFYTQIARFTIREAPMPGGVYRILESGGLGRAGIGPKLQPGPEGWLPYVYVADVDATAAHAERLGAKLATPPTDIPRIGRFAVLVDPRGASTAVMTPIMPAP